MNAQAVLDQPISQTAPVRSKWYRSPWNIVFLVIAVLFVAGRLPFYLAFDSSHSVVHLQPSFPKMHYLLLTMHILFGSIAIVTCSLQVWPWLRNTYPKVHRITGRIYVLAGVLPSGLLALAVSLVSTVAVAGKVGNVLLSLLWLGSTFAGLYYARKRRLREHRRMMIYSFALCWSIIENRLWIGIFYFGFLPLKNGYYHGSAEAMISDVAVASIWMGWVVSLLIAEWWLNRKPNALA
ncbi:MAG TPA: DUF2306 domain-containing protein [Fibrobacteria bacterium]|nr:DUF2306 domain-containing protein [Fibrobacteria bacterium]